MLWEAVEFFNFELFEIVVILDGNFAINFPNKRWKFSPAF